ncbi:25604_t:CDS:2 [Gigaspora margarita]|uniref:25604_t:CDS:1 n=1 Tax=Gigaspora margarita TaxID=4874 RepID=A0ABN7UZW6_GIGMA|nr:25604_t:CDS:2 [Gigaspora margarita]
MSASPLGSLDSTSSMPLVANSASQIVTLISSLTPDERHSLLFDVNTSLENEDMGE